MTRDIDWDYAREHVEIDEFTEAEARFRLDACLKKALGKDLTPEERDVIRDVNRRNGWDRK